MNNSQLDGRRRPSENNWKTWQKCNHMFEDITEPSGQWGVTGTLKWGGVTREQQATFLGSHGVSLKECLWPLIGEGSLKEHPEQNRSSGSGKRRNMLVILSSSPECLSKVHFQGTVREEPFLSTASKAIEIMLDAGTQELAANQRKAQNRERIHRHSDNTYTLYVYFLEQTRKPYGWEDCTSCYCYSEKTGSRNRVAMCLRHQSLRLEAENNSFVSFFKNVYECSYVR